MIKYKSKLMKAMPQLRQLVTGFPPRWPELKPRSDYVGFVVDKVALGQVFSKHFSFPCQFSFHQLLHIYHNLLSRAHPIGQLVADVPSGLSLTPTQETKTTKVNENRINEDEKEKPTNYALAISTADFAH
jgi:hypothetical protein